MALIVCPECGGKISTKAAACPQCGAAPPAEVPARASASGSAPAEPLATKPSRATSSQDSRAVHPVVWVGLAIGLAVLVGAVIFLWGSSKHKPLPPPLAALNMADGPKVWIEAARREADSLYKLDQVRLLCAIATVEANAEDISYCRRTFASALQIVDTISDVDKHNDLKWHYLCDIATAQAKARDWVSALQTAQRIGDDRDRAEALCGIANAQVKSSEAAAGRQTFASAFRAASVLKDERPKDMVLKSIAEGQLEAGDVVAALQTALSIKDGHTQDSLAVAVADKVNADNVAEVLPAAEKLKSVLVDMGSSEWKFKDALLAKISAVQVESGRLYTALETARSLHPVSPLLLRSQRADALDIFDRKSPPRPPVQVADIVALLRNDSTYGNHYESPALRAIAIAQAKAGDLPGAFQTVQALHDDYDKSVALRRIAPQIRSDDFYGILQAAQTLKIPELVSEVLAVIAVVQTNSRDIAAGRQTFARAIQTIKDEPAFEKARALRHIAATQDEANDLPASRQSLSLAAQAIILDKNRNEYDYLKDEELVRIATAQARAGDVAGASQTIQATLHNRDSVRAWSAVAIAHAEAGEWEAAEKAVKQVPMGEKRCSAYLAVADSLLGNMPSRDD